MKLRKILYGLTLMLGCFVLASCVNEEEGPCLPDGQTKVLFTLKLQDNAQTRAEAIRDNWGTGTYEMETGANKDNYIDLSGVKMLIFDSDNTYKGSLEDMIYASKTDGTGYYEEKVYEFEGTAPDGLTKNATYKFVVLANTTIPETPTVTNLNELYFAQNTNAIPMWGVTTAQLSLVAGNLQDIGDIALLRAISKVTVQLSPDMISKGFTLESLQVDNYNNQGFVLPANAFTVAATTSLDQEACVRPKTSAATNLSGTVNNNSVELYLPEYKNIGSTKPATMSVTLKLTEEVEVVDEQGTTQTTTVVERLPFPAGIEFKDYKVDTVCDIVRNHHYIFTITDAKVGHRLQLEVLTVPWEDELVRLDYKESISWNDGGIPKWVYPPTTTTATEKIDGIDYTVLNVKGGDELSCSFTLNAPVGWLWYAELDPLTEGAQNFITFSDGTSTSASGTVGQAATLYLKINPQTTSVVHKSRLRLYVRTPSNDRSIEVGSQDVRYIISREF